MSNLPTHEAEQAAITAECELGICDHPACQEDDADDQCRTCGVWYQSAGDGWDGECPDCADKADTSYLDELVDRCAPRWSWEIIDEIIESAGSNLDSDGDLIVPGDYDGGNAVADLVAAGRAMGLACELANDQPISRREIDALINPVVEAEIVATPALSAAELATILAALRYMQNDIADEGDLWEPGDIATNCGTVEALGADEIDDLCERLNMGPEPEPKTYIHPESFCPSNHYNPGDDICADCGKDLNDG